MTDEDAPNDLDVRLEWPDAEAPPESKRPRRGRASERAVQTLVRQRRPGGAQAEELLRQMDALARAMETLPSENSLDDLSDRVDQLARVVGDQRKSDVRRATTQSRRMEKQIDALTKRIDGLADVVQNLPSAALLTDMVDKMLAVQRLVEALVARVSSAGDLASVIRDEIAASLGPLEEATAAVRRLNDSVVSEVTARSGHEVELQAQIDALAKELRAVRRQVPAKRADRGGVVEAVARAVKEALDAQESLAPATRGKRARRASTATS